MSELTQQNIDRFNAVAAEWDDKPRRVETAIAVADTMLSALQPSGNESAFEFGCGTGLLTAALASHVGRILAMDSAPRMLENLSEKLTRLSIDNVDTLAGDLPDHPPPGPFDLIFSSMTLHHIDDTPSLLRVLFDLLRPGGRIALADLHREDGTFHSDPSGIAHHGFDSAELAGWIADAGLVDCRFFDAHRMNKTLADGTTREFPVFLVCARRPT